MELSFSLWMISPLSDLETRRQILFSVGDITIRNLANESVLVTVGTDPSNFEVERARDFLSTHFQACKMKAIIIDLSRFEFFRTSRPFALAAFHVDPFKGLAFLGNSMLVKMIFRILSLQNSTKCQVKTFKTFQMALHWSRTLK